MRGGRSTLTAIHYYTVDRRLLIAQAPAVIDPIASHILVENRDFCRPHLHSTRPSEYCHNVWYEKKNGVAPRLFVSTESTNVTYGQTDTA